MYKKEVFWYALFIFFIFILVFMTHPFLKYPFDVYRQLTLIEKFINNSNELPNIGKYYWNYSWAHIFSFLGLNNLNLFKKAYIIHYIQLLITFFSIFLFSFSFFKYLIKENELSEKKYLALWSTVIWFTVYATYSMGKHMVWVQWYSISYQLTLPLSFLSVGIVLNLIFEKNRNLKKILLILLLLLLLEIILIIHSMEFIYFLLYIIALCIVFIDKIFIYIKSNLFVGMIIILFILLSFATIYFNIDYVLSKISHRNPIFIKYIESGNYMYLWNKIVTDGELLVNKLNRSFASMNELIYFSLYLLGIFILYIVYQIKTKINLINLRLMIFLILTAIFIYIPINKYSSGIASTITHIYVVNRFYYSSSIFLVIPFFSYLVVSLMKFKERLFFLNFIIILIISAIYIYSKYSVGGHQNYYKNIQSIKKSYNYKNIMFNLSTREINVINTMVKKYESIYGNNIYFYARGDIAFILRYILKKDVYLRIPWNGHNIEKYYYYKTVFKRDKWHKNKILFEIPKDFPDYKPYQ